MDIKPIETIYNGYRFRSRLEARWAVFFDALGVQYEYEPEGFVLPSGKRYLPDFRVKCYGKRGDFAFMSIYPCTNCIYHTGSDVDYANWLDGFCKFQNSCDSPSSWLTLRRPPERTEIVACQRAESIYPFNLYIEVKGKMNLEDAAKIKEFSQAGFSILVVGEIPDPNMYGTYIADAGCLHSYERMDGIDIYPWNYETIDGDYFAAFPAVEDGCFYLDGDDSNYQTMNTKTIAEAFKTARQARFEHGEKPVIERR